MYIFWFLIIISQIELQFRPVFPWFDLPNKTYNRVCTSMNNMMSATWGAWLLSFSQHLKSPSVFSGVRVAQFLVFIVVFNELLFVCLFVCLFVYFRLSFRFFSTIWYKSECLFGIVCVSLRLWIFHNTKTLFFAIDCLSEFFYFNAFQLCIWFRLKRKLIRLPLVFC